MYFKFTSLNECNNCIDEITNKFEFSNNITSKYAIPVIDINMNYIIPKPLNIDTSNLKNMFEYEEVETIQLQQEV